MRIPFFSKFAASPFLEMEEVVDCVCRDFLQNPNREFNEDEKMISVYNQIKESLPVFYKACIYLGENPNIEANELASQINCCIDYSKALIEIQKNQRDSYEFIDN